MNGKASKSRGKANFESFNFLWESLAPSNSLSEWRVKIKVLWDKKIIAQDATVKISFHDFFKLFLPLFARGFLFFVSIEKIYQLYTKKRRMINFHEKSTSHKI